MKRAIFNTLAVSAILAALSLGISGCSSEPRTETRSVETVSDVAIISVHKTTVPDWIEAVGTVRAAQMSQVGSQIMGTIREIRAQEGDRVQPGEILATIDDSQARAAVDQATAAVAAAEKEVAAANSDLTLAQSTLKRYQELYDKKSISPQEFDETKAREKSAEARRDMARAGQAQANAAQAQARTLLGYTAIHAPFAGTVIEKKADPGALASPGMPLFTIEDTRSYRLEVTVNEGDIRSVRAGQSASVALEALGSGEISGRVQQIVPGADSASRSFLVKIQLPADGRLRSGLFGRARFPKGERQTLLIPRVAIVERGQLQGIYVIDANQMSQLRYITLGATVGPQVEVLSGLQDGERIAAAPGTRELGGKQIASKQ
jgi:membrane fusion protein, multidrug efflux system